MASLLIVKPIIPTAIVGTGISAGANLLTPDPREAGVVPAAGASITLDFGAVVTVDTAYAGYHSAVDGQTWSALPTNAAGVAAGPSLAGAATTLSDPLHPYPRHAIQRSAAPVASRYWQFAFNASPSAFIVGNIALGLSFQPSLGHEYGGGRLVGDTGSATRLFGGGFGINPGTTYTGWKWTMGDLTDDEVERLYMIARDVGNSRTVLVVEDPDPGPSLNNRIHWGILAKFDEYERIAPGATRWAMRVDDWA